MDITAQDKQALRVGVRIAYTNGAIRIMAIAEGYAMVRYPRAMPFIVALKELERYAPLREEATEK